MSDEEPPQRVPHYSDNEQHGWPLDQCARNLLATLAGFVHAPTDFKGSAVGHAWLAHRDDHTARIAFTSDRGDGHVQLSTHESHWVKVEVFVSGTLIFRAWADEPYEEKEFWPDAADGVTAPNGDPPGRISKRGRWLQIDRVRFGLPGEGFWSVSDTLD
jgi:hypothetical protein